MKRNLKLQSYQITSSHHKVDMTGENDLGTNKWGSKGQTYAQCSLWALSRSPLEELLFVYIPRRRMTLQLACKLCLYPMNSILITGAGRQSQLFFHLLDIGMEIQLLHIDIFFPIALLISHLVLTVHPALLTFAFLKYRASHEKNWPVRGITKNNCMPTTDRVSYKPEVSDVWTFKLVLSANYRISDDWFGDRHELTNFDELRWKWCKRSNINRLKASSKKRACKSTIALQQPCYNW